MEALFPVIIVIGVIVSVISSFSKAAKEQQKKQNRGGERQRTSAPERTYTPEFPPGAADFGTVRREQPREKAKPRPRENIAPRVGQQEGKAAPGVMSEKVRVSVGLAHGKDDCSVGTEAHRSAAPVASPAPAFTLFGNTDEIVRAVVYSEILKPKFRS